MEQDRDAVGNRRKTEDVQPTAYTTEGHKAAFGIVTAPVFNHACGREIKIGGHGERQPPFSGIALAFILVERDPHYLVYIH
jgi:hypothetical protein